VQSSTGWPLRGNKPVEGWQGTSRTMWSGSGAVSDDDVHMSVTVPCDISFETYFWHVFRAWPKNFTICQGSFENWWPSTALRRLLRQLTPTSLQDLVILAIQHSHIFVGETSKMCRRNVRPVSSKRLSSKRVYFIGNNSVNRGHAIKIYINYCRLNTRKYFFCNRVVNVWNALEASSADFRTLQSFKRFLKNADILTHLWLHAVLDETVLLIR